MRKRVVSSLLADSLKTARSFFRDVSRQARLTGWRHIVGTSEKEFITESIGGGVAMIVYDNDGWLDIYLVNGLCYDALFVTAKPQHAALLHNNHDGTFTNVALKADVALGTWSTGPTLGDYDGDGRLYLFVPGYFAYDLTHPAAARVNELNRSYCQFREVSVFCGPRGVKGKRNHLYHKNGNGTFTDVSAKARDGRGRTVTGRCDPIESTISRRLVSTRLSFRNAGASRRGNPYL